MLDTLPHNRTVSVIMPTYNFGRYLRESVGSVVAQHHTQWELIVIDDGSTDDTPGILAALQDELRDARFRVLRVQNGGVSKARNLGLDAATSDFVAFLDADDRWHPDKLARQVAALAEFPNAAFVFTNFVRFRTDGEHLPDHFSFAPELFRLPARPSLSQRAALLDGDALTALLQVADMPWYPTANLVRRDAIGARRFDTSRRIGEDIEFFARIWVETQAVVIFDILCELRRHEDNASAVLPQPHQLNVIDILTSLRSHARTDQQRAAVRARIGREWASLGYARFHKGDALLAAKAYARALAVPGSRLTSALHLAALPLAWWRGGRRVPSRSPTNVVERVTRNFPTDAG